MKKLNLFVLTGLIIFLTGITLMSLQPNHQTAQKAHNEQLTTYDYVITSIDSEGIHGKSLSDNTGIFLTAENVKGLSLNVHDSIRVSFPNDSYEEITHIQKLKGGN